MTTVFLDDQQKWFESSLGRYVIDHEFDYFDQVVANIFGYNAVQIGLPQFNFLRLNRMPLHFFLGMENQVSIKAKADFLPLQSNSMDLVIMPHVLEFNDNPHQILREVHRALIPEGHIIISGFNPFSLWGMCHYFSAKRREFPWNGTFIALPRVKDWLKLLDFEMMGGRLCCYAPPFQQDDWRKRFHFMEAAGDRWWPISGGVFFLHAVKRTHGMRLIKPGWKKYLDPRARAVPAAHRVHRAYPQRCPQAETERSQDIDRLV